MISLFSKTLTVGINLLNCRFILMLLNDIFNYFSKFWNNLSNNQVKCGKLYLPNSDDYERTINKSILTQCSISILPENVRKPLRFWWVKNWLGTTWWNSDCNVFYFHPHLLPITYLFNCSVKLIFWDIRCGSYMYQF